MTRYAEKYPLEKLQKRFEYALSDLKIDSVDVALGVEAGSALAVKFGSGQFPSAFVAEIYITFDTDQIAAIGLDSEMIHKDDRAEKFFRWRIEDNRAKRGVA